MVGIRQSKVSTVVGAVTSLPNYTYMTMYLRAPNGISGILYSLSLLILLIMFASACQTGADASFVDSESDQGAIHELLMNQQQSWNEGDIQAYMSGYLDSDSLRFASAASVQYGWQATLERYQKTYPDRAAMGQLTFSELDIDILSRDWAMAFGEWNLERGGSYGNIGGLFTLVLVRTQDGWRIKFDHTSSRS